MLIWTAQPAAAAGHHKHGHKHSKPKPKPAAHCTLGQARVTVGKSTRCVSNTLPVPHSTPQAATATAALHMGIGKTRDRRGRHSKSLPQLLRRIGPHAYADLEHAITSGLSRGESLDLGGARAARAATVGRSADSSSGCGSGIQYAGGKSKVGEADVSLDIQNGALKLGIDLKGNGISVSVTLRSCGDGTITLDSCPTAEGKVEGHGQTELEASFKVSEGATVVMAQAFKFGAQTTIKAQTGDDGKLDYYDIKHVYTIVGSFGGSKAAFGPITVDATYIGEAHIDMHSSGGAPPPAQVDVMMSMAGVDPAARIAAEIKVAHESQAQADKEFAAEVKKATDDLRNAEKHWMTPKACAKIAFEPGSNTITVHKGQSGTFTSRTEASGGGAPAAAKWTVSGQENATFTPSGSEGNPLSTSYNVTNAGPKIYVEVTLMATSKAGVAEEKWIQKTDEPLNTLTGTFKGHVNHEGEIFDWTGTATLKRIELEIPSEVSRAFKVVSGEATITASGVAIGSGCEQTGTHTLALSPYSTWAVEHEEAPFNYEIVLPFNTPGGIEVTWTHCSEPANNGVTSFASLSPAALESGEVQVENSGGGIEVHFGSYIKQTSDLYTYENSATAAGLSPDETWEWSWSFKGSP